MAGSNNTPVIPAALREQLQLTGALARERLMDVHFRYAMELIDRTRQDLDLTRALSIYSRLHGIRAEDANALCHRVFVALGRRNPPKPFVEGASEGSTRVETPQSLVGLIRRRLRGRVNSELREWVEYHTGRAETELLWSHVENALQFVELLEPILGVGAAVTLYAQELAVPPARAEIVYYFALAHLSASASPAIPAGLPGNDRHPHVFAEPAHRSLRIVPSRRGSRRSEAG